MDLIAKDSGGHNLVAREQAEPHWYPAATAPAARVQVWKRNADQPPSAAVYVGTFEPGARVEIDFNPAFDRNVLLGTISLSADGTPSVTRLEDAVWAELIFERTSAPVGGIDAHVPTVTAAPTVAKAEAVDEWVVFTPAPDAYGATLTDGEIKVEKVDDASAYEVLPVPVSPHHRLAQKPYPCVISYRWRNQSSEDAGNGRGWSDWSPGAGGAEIGAPVPPPPVGGVLSTFTYDPNDSRAGIEVGVIAE